MPLVEEVQVPPAGPRGVPMSSALGCDLVWEGVVSETRSSHRTRDHLRHEVAPRVTFRYPFFPSHVASGRCFLSAAAAGALAGVVSAFAEPSGWCAGAVLDVAGCAVCASVAPSSWRVGVVLVVVGVV